MKISLIFFTVIIIIIIFFKPKFTFNRIVGSGNIINEERNIMNFTTIKVIGSVDVNVNFSNDYSCSIITDDNLIPYIKTEVIKNVLNISMDKNYSTRQGLKVNLTVPNINKIFIKGSGDVNISDINNETLLLNIDGSGDIAGYGSSTHLIIKINGSGDVILKDLKSETTDITINGSGDAQIWVSNTILAVINGSGDIDYFGEPSNITSDINGSGEINPH